MSDTVIALAHLATKTTVTPFDMSLTSGIGKGEHSTEIKDNLFLSFGGSISGNITTQGIYALDLTANTWSFQANFSSPVSFRRPNVYLCSDGLIHIAGGDSNGAGYDASYTAYNVATKTHTGRGGISSMQGGMVCVEMPDGLLHLIAATIHTSTGLNAGNTWTSKAFPPFGNDNFKYVHPHCIINNIVYVYSNLPSAGFYSYDSTTNTWTTLAAPPAGSNIYGTAMGVDKNGEIVVLGEHQNNHISTRIWIYNITQNQWRLSDHQTPWGWHGLGQLRLSKDNNGDLIWYGGYSQSLLFGYSDKVTKYITTSKKDQILSTLLAVAASE